SLELEGDRAGIGPERAVEHHQQQRGHCARGDHPPPALHAAPCSAVGDGASAGATSGLPPSPSAFVPALPGFLRRTGQTAINVPKARMGRLHQIQLTSGKVQALKLAIWLLPSNASSET